MTQYRIGHDIVIISWYVFLLITSSTAKLALQQNMITHENKSENQMGSRSASDLSTCTRTQTGINMPAAKYHKNISEEQ